MTEKKMIDGYIMPYLRALATPLLEMAQAFDDEFFVLEKICKGKSVLDMGAGVGRPAYCLHTSCKDMYLVDNDPEMVKIMKERFWNVKGVFVSQDEATKLGFGANAFDVALATYNFIGCLAEPEKLVPEMRRVLKDDGLAFLCAWNTTDEATDILKRYYPSIGIKINSIHNDVTDTDHGVIRRPNMDYLVNQLEKNGFKVIETGFLGGGKIWTYAIGKKVKK